MCGIFAIVNHPEASQMVRFGLHALQHRGEEAVGIASSDGHQIHLIRKRGWVGEVITDEDCKKLPGNMAIGHVRYSTRGGPSGTNTQPLYARLNVGQIAIAHNGQISNSSVLRDELEDNGAILQTSTDTEVILHFMSRANKECNMRNKLANALKKTSGAYSIVLLTEKSVIVARDKNGIRPLVLGRIGDTIIASSESCAIDFLGGRVVREVRANEQVELIESEIFKDLLPRDNMLCVFEHIYFARPDSILESKPVYNSRIKLGMQLAKEEPAEADICVPVPDSGIEATIGYSKESNIPFERGLSKAHYTGRTFIQPSQVLRNRKIRLKLNPVASILKNKRIVIVDDSIVRGNTSKRIVTMLREAGAKEIHMRISSPPVKFPCYYGIDTPNENELIASSMSILELQKAIGCDSLGYLSYDGMIKAIGIPSCCDACFSGNYPI